ncbi:hypothetical protein [Natrinema halophilum]|uniref:hypothetical protein n=1 Tax=Natrinema halophilum TaxID=1699371 RepID=UPI001F21CD21|nr:hypothetical protein [Natrinema halophilum]UHQ96445.1 hypothetical protein HYG82_23685 [Natrinema halophilum]
MSTTYQPKDVSNDSDDVERLLESVSNGRVTVQRVLEFIRGKRSKDEMKGSDWLNAINHVRRHCDETLVLYAEGDCKATSICRTDYGAIDRVDFGTRSGRHRQFVSYDVAKDDLHKTGWEVLTHDEAKRRFDAYVRAHEDHKRDGGDA